MIELRMVKHLQHGVNRAGFGVFSAVDEPPDTRVGDGAGTHRARLEGHIKITIEQPVVTNGLPGLAERQDLRVRRGVVSAERAVASPAYDTRVADDDSADGHFAQGECTFCLAQGFCHPEFVGEGHGQE
jgi:hypothetical protein